MLLRSSVPMGTKPRSSPWLTPRVPRKKAVVVVVEPEPVLACKQATIYGEGMFLTRLKEAGVLGRARAAPAVGAGDAPGEDREIPSTPVVTLFRRAGSEDEEIASLLSTPTSFHSARSHFTSTTKASSKKNQKKRNKSVMFSASYPCRTPSSSSGKAPQKPFPRSLENLRQDHRPRSGNRAYFTPHTPPPDAMRAYSTSVADTIKNFMEEYECDSCSSSMGLEQEEVPLWEERETWSSTPTSSDPDLENCIVVINVAGEDFLIKLDLLRKHPETLLGSDELFEFHVPALSSYFFDRNRALFEFILQFYQTGKIVVPEELDKNVVQKELDFFKIKYRVDGTVIEEEEVVVDQNTEAQAMLATLDKDLGKWISRKLTLFLFLTNPQSSVWAMIWTVVDLTFVVFSVVCLFLESERDFSYIFTDTNASAYKVIKVIEAIIQTFFTLDFVLRMIAWPSKDTFRGVKSFMTNGNNICDIFSLLPFYLPQMITLLDDRNVKSLVVLRIIRTFRVARLFRIVRHSKQLSLIFDFLLNSNISDMVVLFELFVMMILVFSSLMHFCENDGDPNIFSIPSAMWWVVLTVTGIGYGDVYPRTTSGKMLGAVTMISGIIFLALPLSIILHEFSRYMRAKGLGYWKGMDTKLDVRE